jgi:uncharacterized pyridoxamine 5'-phosphate oxidase family protein
MADQRERVVGYLRQVPAWYLATCEGDRPHVRPFSFAAVEDGRIWFCTSKGKDVYDELIANPYFELSAWNPGNPWVVVSGRAAFGEPSAALRQEGFEHMVGIGEAHESPDDGRLVFFYVDEGHARVCEITGVEEGFDI